MCRFLSRIIFTLVLIPYLCGLNLTHKHSCQCIYLPGTQGKVWGKFMISSSEVRYNKSECLHIFITGAEQEIIELRFDIINLRKQCVDQIHIFPHLHESVLQNSDQPEDTICLENSKMFTSGDVLSSFLYPRQIPSTESPNITSNNIENVPVDINHNFKPLTRSQFRINHRASIFSSGRVLGMRLIYSSFRKDEDAFHIVGRFQFIDRVMFKNDGNLVATTYCDYQFLPQPINYVEGKRDSGVEPWRHFYSPRYPAKYPDHIKCTYKFVGRPRNRVEVLFEEIYLLTGHISCLHNSDKITVHDSKTANMSSIIDVFCNERPTMKIASSGPNLVIEFEASSNRTSNGFSAKYRFIDISAEEYSYSETKNTNVMNTITSATPMNSGEALHNNSIVRKFSKHATTISKTIEQIGNQTIPITNLSELYSGSSVIQPGSLLIEKVLKTDNITSIKFIGHNSSTGVRVCPPGSNCDTIISSKTVKNGTIQSPMFPAPYPPRTLCRFEFQGQGKERIQIKFFEFSLPSEGDSYDCEEADILQVLVPTRDRYELVESLCGDTVPKPILSNGPKMLLEFRGRQSGKGNRGFKAEYRFLENFGIISGEQIPEEECSFKFNSSVEKSGWFHSPNFPGAYPRNIECNYLFYGDLYDRVFIRFQYFDVEGIFPCEESTASDYVEFSNFLSIDRKFRRFCGNRSGFSVRSDGRFFRITFHTNDRFDKTGFRASYSFDADQPTTEGSYTQEFNRARDIFSKSVFNSIIILLGIAALL